MPFPDKQFITAFLCLFIAQLVLLALAASFGWQVSALWLVFSSVYLGYILAKKDKDNLVDQPVLSALFEPAEEDHKLLAYYDPLTKLPNRRLLSEMLEKAIKNNRRSKLFGAVIFIDLDNFKKLNDTKGHADGDALLVDVSARLRACVREADTVSRFGGDEFVVLLDGLSISEDESLAAAKVVTEKILTAVNRNFHFGDYEHRSGCSLGVALFSGDEAMPDILEKADIAMYEAKRGGKNKACFSTDTQMIPVLTLAEQVALAIEKNQLSYLVRPRYRISDNKVIAVELIPCIQGEAKLVPLNNLNIKTQEEFDLFLEVERRMILQACQISNTPKFADSEIKVSVSLSAIYLRYPAIIDTILLSIRNSGCYPSKLELVIARGFEDKNFKQVLAGLSRYHAAGIELCVEAGEPGSPVFAELEKMKGIVSTIKVGKSFISHIKEEDSDFIFIKFALDTIKNHEFEVVADGVETPHQKELLLARGCNYMQGDLFGAAMELDEFFRSC